MVASKTILLLLTNPIDTNYLRLQEEEREIRERLRLAGLGKFSIHSSVATRPQDIQLALLDTKPQIVHFSGHGIGEAGLIFEDVSGNSKIVSSEALAHLFKLFAERGVECVVLNACYSQAQAIAIGQYIEYVIGMTQAIEDRTAIKFASGFYTALSCGEPYEFSFKIGCNAIHLENLQEYSIPVLFRNGQRYDPEVLVQQEHLKHEQHNNLKDTKIITNYANIILNKNSQETNSYYLPNFQLHTGLTNDSKLATIRHNHEEELEYEILIDFLQSCKWKEANYQTYKLILSLTGCQKEKILTEKMINNISCEDINRIDKLWTKYSRNRFGFSVQHNIWNSKKVQSNHIRFSECVGWLKDSQWLNYDDFQYKHDNEMLLGYLPIFMDIKACDEIKLKLELQWTRFLKVFFPTLISKMDFCGL